MPLPLTVSCFSKIQIGFIFPVPADPGSPGQRAVKRVCVCGAACGGVYVASSGNITSPHYPDPYPNNKQCVYVIRQPEGSTITLTFLRFHVEASHGRGPNATTCRHDFLEVSQSLPY